MNLFKKALIRNALRKKKSVELHKRFSEEIHAKTVALAQEATPVDYGLLRESFAKDSECEIKGNKAIITIRNSAEYASHVEWGIRQPGGYVLRVRFDKGKMRVIKALGRSKYIPKGKSENKVTPDENGEATIVTRQYKRPGVHMVKRAVDEIEKEIPKRLGQLIEKYLK